MTPRSASRPVRRVFAVLFWAAIAVTFGLAMLTRPPNVEAATNAQVQEAVVSVLTVSDKAQHLLAFALLAALAFAAWPGARALKVLAGLSAYGAVIELAQATPIIGGDTEWGDWVADTAAVAVFVMLVAIVRRYRR